MTRGWKIALALAAVTLVVFVGILVSANGDDTHDPADRVGRITQMEQSGEMHRMLEQHRKMLEQMASDASPAMLELMNKDPMWQMMRSAEWAQMDEQHEADIDRMLGK